MSYSKLLRDPRWQRKRLEIFNRDEWTCKECGNDTRELQVHHKEYINGLMPWEYEDELLVTLCVSCHKKKNKSNQLSFIESIRRSVYRDLKKKLKLPAYKELWKFKKRN